MDMILTDARMAPFVGSISSKIATWVLVKEELPLLVLVLVIPCIALVEGSRRTTIEFPFRGLVTGAGV